MTGNKYDRFFIRGPKPGETRPGFKDCIAFLDDDVIKNSLYFMMAYNRPDWLPPSHGPHMHNCPEILGWFGINPEDPYDLGGECTLYMGEEMERHDFNKSTLVYIPANVVHGPIVYREINRPYIFLYTLPVAVLQETSRKDLVNLVPEEDRARIIFPYDK
ncbi:MAG: hypothetical protein JW967_11525 [Dehalococcoidales bacterium]|nr:hypothetical protein [Dehalococcoidales bacterium]